MMTLMGNLEQRMSRILLQDLPKTFREAVEVCRALNIDYLWIDSMCIIQDSARDWQIQSSQMHSIYHGSTLTLAAMDAIDSSHGLFIPKALFVDIVPLSPAFGDRRGQVYVGPPTWNAFTHSYGPFLEYAGPWSWSEQMSGNISPHIQIQSGLLDTRAWAMQELRLSRRVLYFFKGHMIWKCTKAIWNQDGSRQLANTTFHLGITLTPFESQSKGTCDRFTDNSHQFPQREHSLLREDDYKDWDGTTIATLEQLDMNEPKNSDGGDDIGSTGAPSQTSSVFDSITNYKKRSLSRIWFDIVEEYSRKHLTFPDDKLPALSGIASRFFSISKDDYIAGHWRRGLEKSLFWGAGTSHNFRAKSYRAPTWSWASVDKEIAQIGQDQVPVYDPLESVVLLDVVVQVKGDNPFGRVDSGKIVVSASTIEAHWRPGERGWLSRCSSLPDHVHYGFELPIFGHDGCMIGHWTYDDALYGIMPGPRLTTRAAQAEIQARRIPFFSPISGRLEREYNPAAGPVDTFWSRATYVPEDLLLVRGPTTQCDSSEHATRDDEELDIIHVLVLKKTHEGGDEYERVGIGELSSWDKSVETRQTLTIV
jgi:hypothetical protein